LAFLFVLILFLELLYHRETHFKCLFRKCVYCVSSMFFVFITKYVHIVFIFGIIVKVFLLDYLLVK
jgi:hypothetical protein